MIKISAQYVPVFYFLTAHFRRVKRSPALPNVLTHEVTLDLVIVILCVSDVISTMGTRLNTLGAYVKSELNGFAAYNVIIERAIH